MANAKHITRRAALSAACATAAAGAVAAPALAATDQRLIALEAELLSSIEAGDAIVRAATDTPQGEADIDAALAHTSKIVSEIEDEPASSIRGLQVKALAIAWCCGGTDSFGPNDVDFGRTTDCRLATDIVKTLLKGRVN